MSAAVRVLLVGPLPPPSGGMANQTRQLASLLRKEGVQVDVVQSNAPYRPRLVGRIPVLRAFFRLIPYLMALRRGTREANVAHVMANSGWAWFFFAVPAIHVAHWRRVPVVVNYRGGLAEEFLARRSRAVVATLRKVRLLVVPSGFLHAIFARYDVDAQVIPNIVNVDTFSPCPGRAAAAHVVVARNLEKIYGIDVAIRAVAQLRPRITGLRVSIAGSGPERDALERLTRELGVSDVVRFTGRLEVEQMAALYRGADVVLNPSRVDNTPNSILEALACGVPVVSTDVGGVPFLVQHERTAYLVSVDDPTAMASGLERVLTDPTLRANLRESGLALAQACSWESVKQQWLRCYRELAGQR